MVTFFQNLNNAQSATYLWQQSSWSGGQTSNSDTHPGKIGGWDEYSSKDSFVKTINSGSDVQLNWTAGSTVQTSDNGIQDNPNVGGFNAGTKISTRVRGSAELGRVDLAFAGVSYVATGKTHSLAIRSDNTLWAWGSNGSGQLGDGTATQRYTPTQVLNSDESGYFQDIETVSAGNNFSLALKSDGTVWAWGNNDNGQLGDNTNDSSNLPVQVLGVGGEGFLSDITAIASGENFSLALKSDGTVLAWGENTFGQLGDDSTSGALFPVEVVGAEGSGFLENISAISAGENFSLALKSDGTVWAWGRNNVGQLGDGLLSDSEVPIQIHDSTGVGFLEGISKISAGASHSLALKADGTGMVFAWGLNDQGQLGTGNFTNRSLPTQVRDLGGAGLLTNVSNISTGLNHSMIIKNDKSAWAWGLNSFGQLGDSTILSRNLPTQIFGIGGSGSLSNISMIAGGESHSLAFQSDGTLLSWGRNNFGQIGSGGNSDLHFPERVSGPASGSLTDVVAVSSGYAHSLALKSDGTVWSWGWNGYGQLGDTSTVDKLTPVQVVGENGTGFLNGVTAIAAGYAHSMALLEDNTIVAWGWASSGQLGYKTVASGGYVDKYYPVHVLDSSGVGNLSNVISISSSDQHSVALVNDGINPSTLFAWGGNIFGQIGDNTNENRFIPVQVHNTGNIGNLMDVVSVSAGSGHTVAVKSDGTVWAWGHNDKGQLGNNTRDNSWLPVQVLDETASGNLFLGTGELVSVSAGSSHTLALTSDGNTLWAWGSNSNGQLGDGTTNEKLIPIKTRGIGGVGYLSGISSIKTGLGHSLALFLDGQVSAWGSGGYGQLGNGTNGNSSFPGYVLNASGGGNISNISFVAAGENQTLAVSVDNNVVSGWGLNNKGQLGINNIRNKSLPVNAWNSTTGFLNVGHTFYASSGSFVSNIIDSGSFKTLSTLNFNDVSPDGTSILVDIRAGNNPVPDSSWSLWTDGVSNGEDISFLGERRYFQFRLSLFTSDTNLTPSFNDISFNYQYYPSPGHLVSSAYDTSDSSNILSRIRWSQSLQSGTDINFQVRTAPDENGIPGAWTAWVGPDGTGETFFTDNTGLEMMPNFVRDGIEDQWIQYQALLISDGLNSPTLLDVTTQYVVNAPPEIQNVIAIQDENGVVNVGFDVRDPDSEVVENVTPGKVIIGLQYCSANCSSNGAEVWTNASTLGGNVGSGISVEEVAWKSYQLEWNAKSDYPDFFNGTDFKIRVVANDSEGANNLGFGNSNNFVLDTKNPVDVSFFIDHTSGNLHINSPLDDSSYQMIVSNLSDFSDATYQPLQNVFEYSRLSTDQDPVTVYLRIRDAYGNYTSVSERTPIKLSELVYYDISNPATEEYRELISWRAPDSGETGSGGFAKYNIWRASDGGEYEIVNSITDENVNYYLDSNLTTGISYSYRMTLEDGNGNISDFSSIVSDVPDGEGGVNAVAPIISNVQVQPTSITSNSATINWETDVSSNSTVGFSSTPGDFSNEIGIATLKTSDHSVTITGLQQDTTYYFRVKSAGINNSVGIEDNFNVSGNHNGYEFATTLADTTPPTISDISSQVLTRSGSVFWSTNEEATSFIEYSTQAGFSSGSSYGSYDLTLSHGVVLPNVLEPNTTYYFKIHSRDGSGNEEISSEGNFHTEPLGDINGPLISSIEVFSKTHNTATINWTTNESSNSYVEYGTTTLYGKTFGSGVLVSGTPFNHSVSLPQDLLPDTDYHFRVRSTDSSGNTSTSDDYSFTTEVDPSDIVAPVLTIGPVVSSISSTSATITWSTDEISTSFVDYAQTIGNFNLEQGNASLTQSHSVTLTSLTPDTTYHYQLKSVDASNNIMLENNEGEGFIFSTTAGQPPVLQGVPLATQNSFNSFNISWETDIASDSFVEFSTVSDFSGSLVLGKYDNVTNHSVELQNLSPEENYYYRVRSSSEFEMVSGTYSFETGSGTDTIRPLISNVQLSGISDNGVNISWETSEDADSVVYIGETLNYDMLFGNGNEETSEHSVDVNGLAPATAYSYQIVSKDASGNVTYGLPGTFTTNSLAGAPIISNIEVFVASDIDNPTTYNQVTITWDTDIPGDSRVSFSPDDSFSHSISYPQDLVTEGHSVVISDLALDETYNYRVSTQGTNGLITVSTELSFETARDPKYLHDPLAEISDVVSIPGSSSASVTFGTDQLAKCVIEYRSEKETYPGGLSSESDFNKNHRMQLLSLSNTTEYFFKINCQDNIESVPITSDEYSFTTDQSNGNGSDKILPVISGVKVGKPTGESVEITWNTDKKASSFVRYGTKSTFGFMVGDDVVNVDQTKYATSHSVILNSLVPATKYYYSVLSVDDSGNIAESSSGNFTTATQSTLSSISIISKVLGEAVVSWSTNQNMTSTVEYGLTNSYGSKSESSSQTKAHEVSLKKLSIGQLYHFRVKSGDSAGNIFVSGDYVFQPKSPPVISDVAVGEITESGATVTFATNVPSDSVAAYVAIDDLKDSGSQGQTTLVLAHSVVLKNLSPGKTYSLRVQAKDESGNAAELAGPNFTIGKDTTPPVIDQIHTDSALAQNDKVQSIISWTTNENATTAIIYKEGKNGDEKEINIGDAYAKNHLAVMTVFKPGVVYFFRVKSIDATGNNGISNDFALLTPKKRENIIQIIINNFQEIFHWANM
ncbi:MAG: hypothetical protein HGA61_01670 [Candidatus Moranbacteria bacterium]|nr:hypothetical protein [Candidatus Moranbacteria bacterium]